MRIASRIVPPCLCLVYALSGAACDQEAEPTNPQPAGGTDAAGDSGASTDGDPGTSDDGASGGDETTAGASGGDDGDTAGDDGDSSGGGADPASTCMLDCVHSDECDWLGGGSVADCVAECEDLLEGLEVGCSAAYSEWIVCEAENDGCGDEIACEELSAATTAACPPTDSERAACQSHCDLVEQCGHLTELGYDTAAECTESCGEEQAFAVDACREAAEAHFQCLGGITCEQLDAYYGIADGPYPCADTEAAVDMTCE